MDDTLSSTELAVVLTALGTWPIADTCPDEVLPDFSNMQSTVEQTALVVDSTLPNDADMLSPTAFSLGIAGGQATQSQHVQLQIAASTDTEWMYLREWTWTPDSNTWKAVHDSGWQPYATVHPWVMSEGDGIKFRSIACRRNRHTSVHSASPTDVDRTQLANCLCAP